MNSTETKTEALPVLDQLSMDRLFTGVMPVEEDFIMLDHRTCDCELTYVHRKRHAALGTGIQIRLCCLAKKVEELCGLPPGTFFKAIEFEPTWVWDCDKPQETQHKQPDGSIISQFHKLGPPPAWLLKRMRAKGIEVKNLPADAG